MGSKKKQKMAAKPLRHQESHTGKKRKKLQAQFIVCRRLCRTTPEVKRMMKRLSSSRKYCKNYEWKRRPFVSCNGWEVRDNADSQYQEKESVTMELEGDANTEKKDQETVTMEVVGDANAERKEEEPAAESTADSNSKFSHSSAVINVMTGSENLRKKRVMGTFGQLGLDSCVLLKQAQDPNKQDILFPCIMESSDATQANLAAANKHPKFSGPQKLKRSKPNKKYVSEHTQGESNIAEPQNLQRSNTTKKDLLEHVQRKSNTARQMNLKRSKASDKKVCKQVDKKLCILRPQRIKKDSQDASEDLPRKSNAVGPQNLNRSTDKDVSEHIQTENVKAPPTYKKRGRKRKEESGNLLLQQMIQCCKLLQNSCSDSHKHIAQLLSQEIEKAKEGELATTSSEGSHCQSFDTPTRPSETAKPRNDEHRVDSIVPEDFESQVLEIEATFLVKSSAAEGQEISGASLFLPTMQYSDAGVEVSGGNKYNTAGGLSETLNENSSEVLPLILSPQHAQFKPYTSFPTHIFSESLSPDPNDTMSGIQFPNSPNIPSVSNVTQETDLPLQNYVQAQPHYTLSNCIQSEPHPSHHITSNITQQEILYTVQSHTQAQHHSPPSYSTLGTSPITVPHCTEPKPISPITVPHCTEPKPISPITVPHCTEPKPISPITVPHCTEPKPISPITVPHCTEPKPISPIIVPHCTEPKPISPITVPHCTEPKPISPIIVPHCTEPKPISPIIVPHCTEPKPISPITVPHCTEPKPISPIIVPHCTEPKPISPITVPHCTEPKPISPITVPHCTEPKPISPITVPHCTEPKPNSCLPDHTETKVCVSISQENPTEPHLSIPDDTMTDAGVQEDQVETKLSSPQHSQLGPVPVLSHHTQTERHSLESESLYPFCSSPKKKRRKKCHKSISNYNLRSKHLSNDTSETVTPTQPNNMNMLLKKHCKNQPRVYLKKMELDPDIVIRSMQCQRLPAPNVSGMSLPVSIPVSKFDLPNIPENIMKVLKKDIDSQERECVKGKEGNSKTASIEGDNERNQDEEKGLVLNTQGGADNESCESMMDADNNIRKTELEDSLDGIVDETCAENCQKMEANEISQKETDAEQSRRGRVEMFSDKTCGENSQKAEACEMSQEGTEAEHSENTQGGSDIEGCQMANTSADNSQEGINAEQDQMADASSGADKSQEETNAEQDQMADASAEPDQMVDVSGENSQEGTNDKQDQMVDVSAENSQERESVEVGEMVVVVSGEENQGWSGVERGQMRVESGDDNQEETNVKGDHMMVVSVANKQEIISADRQVYDGNKNHFVPSLYTDGNSPFDFDNITLSLDQRDKLYLYDFPTKRLNFDKTSIKDAGTVTVSVRPPLGDHFGACIIKQSGTLVIDEGKVPYVAGDEKSLPLCNKTLGQSECGGVAAAAAGELYEPLYSQTEESNTATQHVHHLPNEAQLLEDLEKHFENTVKAWVIESNFETPSVALKDNTVDIKSRPQESLEEQDDPRQDKELLCADPTLAPHLQHHNIHSHDTNLSDGIKAENEKTKDEEDSSDSDDDVLSIYTSDYSLLDSDANEEENPLPQANNSRDSYNHVEKDYVEQYSSVNKSEEMADWVQDMLIESPDHSISCDGLEVGIGSDEALNQTDSDVESLQSKSSVIDRIVLNEARCSLEESLEDDTLKNLASGNKGNQSNEGEGPTEVSRDRKDIVIEGPSPRPSKVLQSKSPLNECTDPLGAPDSSALMESDSPYCVNPSQSQKNTTFKQQETSFRDREEACNRTTSDQDSFEVCESNKKDLPLLTTPGLLSSPSPVSPYLLPPYNYRPIRVPKPKLPENQGICFLFINRGVCERRGCHYRHEITLECETYLGLLILHFVTEGRQPEAWSLLGSHLAHRHNSLHLAVSLLLPLARHLVALTHNKHSSCIMVPSSLTLPLDIAKVRILCEQHQGKAAFKLLYSCYSAASPEGQQTLLNTFVRYCDSFPENEMVSPWEKLVLWGFDCPASPAEAKLKDLFNFEWLRIQIVTGNAYKVWKVYSHLSEALTTPCALFTRITCQVINFYRDTGRLRDSFSVMGEVRRLRANSCSIFTALIPTNRENVQDVAGELQELSQLVCELCVPLSASSWSLLLSHMKNISDLSQTMDLVLMQINFMTPEIDTLKWLFEECIAKGPTMLQPLCNLVCLLPREVLKSLKLSLSCLLNVCPHATPSGQHMKSLIIQHCRKFGIQLRPLIDGSTSLMEEQVEPCQSNSSVFLKESNSRSISYNSSSDNSNTTTTSTIDSSSSSSSSCNKREDLQDHIPSPGSAFIHNENTCEVSAQMENTAHDGECVQILRPDNGPGIYGQSELPLPPTPKSLPPSVGGESVVNHCLEEIGSITKPVQQEEHTTTQTVYQHFGQQQQQQQQQPRVRDYSQQPSYMESPCNLKTQDKNFTVMRAKNSSHDVESFLMSPDSTNISPNISLIKSERGEESPVNVLGKVSKSIIYCGSQSEHSSHSHNEELRQTTYSESTSKDFNSFEETIVSKNLRKFGPLKNSNVIQKSGEVPQFRVIKRNNFSLPKFDSNQDLRDHAPDREEGSGLYCLPSYDETTSSGVKVNCDRVAPLKFPQVAKKVLKMFSIPTSTQNVESSNQQDTRSFRHEQPTSSQQIQQDFGKDNIPDQLSGWSGKPFNMQHNHWFQMEKVGPLDHMRRHSSTRGSSPSSSVFSDPYLHSSSTSRPSSRMSLRSECGEMDGTSSEQGASMMVLHKIAATQDEREKKNQVAELAASLTNGSNIYSSGTKFSSIMKTCSSGVLSREVREVMGALGMLVLLECVQQKIFSEAELTILGLHHHRLPFFNNFVSWEESYSEQQVAVKALWVLHHMKNYSLFIDILEETSWSGSVDDIKARLELLREVLDMMSESGKTKISLWYTGKILASLVTYYHNDTKMIHNYHDFLDLPGHLEAAWEWVEARGIVEVVEQFTVILSTALRLNLPLQQPFIFHLMKKGIVNIDMAPNRGFGECPLPHTNQRGRMSRRWMGRQRQGRAVGRGNMKRGAFQGTSRGSQLYFHGKPWN